MEGGQRLTGHKGHLPLASWNRIYAPPVASSTREGTQSPASGPGPCDVGAIQAGGLPDPSPAERLWGGYRRVMSVNDELLSALAQLKVGNWPNGGPTPHKPVTLLAYLHRLELGGERLVTYRDLEPLTEQGITACAPEGTKIDARQPFWRLQNDGLWEVVTDPGFDGEQPAAGADPPPWIDDPSVRAGLRPRFFAALRDDPELVQQARDLLVGRLEPAMNEPALALGFESAQRWDIAPGERVERMRVKDRFGGFEQGGINPCKQTPNIWITADPAVDLSLGYTDGPTEDGSYYYTGTGQSCDQTFEGNPGWKNGQLLEHQNLGLAVRLFTVAGETGETGRQVLRYEGQYRVDPDDPFHREPRPDNDAETGERNVIVFHSSRPDPSSRTGAPAVSSSCPTRPPRPVACPSRPRNTETFLQHQSANVIKKERREQQLVHEYQAHLEGLGHSVTRRLYQQTTRRAPLACDLIDETDGVLVEAKSGVRREHVRMAIGQLIDYQRLEAENGTELTLRCLLPRRPQPDLVELLHHASIEPYRTDTGEFVVEPVPL